MTFRKVTIADWRAQVEKELAGASFDEALIHRTPEGLNIEPLYVVAPPENEATPFTRGANTRREPFRVCMRWSGDGDELTENLEGGAEALWVSGDADLNLLFENAKAPGTYLVLDLPGTPAENLAALVEATHRHSPGETFVPGIFSADPVTAVARAKMPVSELGGALAALAHTARVVSEKYPLGHAVTVSTLPFHEAGADAADELAMALSTGALYLGALLSAGFDVAAAARQVAVQISVGRDTFGELCKLRALRLLWHKLLTAAGAPEATLAALHAVCSSRTVTEEEPWTNMLRNTTQMFAAILGGANLITPTLYDQATGTGSALGRRVARNTGLVLREESHLGQVIDPAGGSYYLESLTDALAREAWSRFRTIEREGGIAARLSKVAS